MPILVEHDDGEVVVSEPVFHMHTARPTEAEALAAFRATLVAYHDMLSEQQEDLGPHMQNQLDYLRGYLERAS